MIRVKYPTKKEIRAQARGIIERSEIFDEIAGDEYTECQRVNNRSTVWKNTVYVMAGIAAAVALLIVLESLLGVVGGLKGSHAYGPSIGTADEAYGVDDILKQSIAGENSNSDNILNNNDIYSDSYVQSNSGSEKIDSVSIITSTRGTYKNDRISIERVYQTPKVSKNGSNFTEISNAYGEYTQRIDSYLQDKYYANGSAYEGYKGVSVKADLTVSYNSSYYNGVENIISFTNKYEEVAGSNGTNIEKKLSVYYGNYDVETGQRIALSDVYTSDLLYNTIAAAINQEINQMIKEGVFSLQSISDKYIGESKIAESVKNDDNWYISPMGSLVIQCNDFREAKDLDGTTYNRAESFIIDSNTLKFLDKNSKYITYK